MSKKILLVDDEPDILEIEEVYLSQNGYVIEQALNGRLAIEKILSNDYDLIVSDLKMPECSGVDLIRWLHKEKKKTPVVFVTGFSDMADAREVAQLGCRGLVPKPIQKEELQNLVRSVLEGKVYGFEEVESAEKEFIRVSLEEFICGKNIQHSLYIKIGDQKFIKVANTGEDIDLERITNFKYRGVQELWIKKTEFKTYESITEKVRQLTKKSEKIEDHKKVKLLKHSLEIAFEQLQELELEESKKDYVFSLLNECIEVALREEGLSGALQALEDSYPSVYADSVACSIMCAYLTVVMDWVSEKNIKSLILGAFLHDLGLTKLPEAIVHQEPLLLSEEDLKLYQTHPKLGLEMLESNDSIPQEVKMIMLQHHENLRGTGYPSGLTRQAIFPMAKTVFLVDHFLVHLRKKKKNMDRLEVFEKMITKDQSLYDSTSVIAMRALLHEPNLEKAKNFYKKNTDKR